MVMVEGGDDVGADPALGEGSADPGGQADRRQAGVDGERDPRPALTGPDQGHALAFPDQGEQIAERRRVGGGFEAELPLVELRIEPGQQAPQIFLPAQLSLRLRAASVRSLSALSRMKPAASR